MFNETELSFGTAVALGALSILLAWLTKITVEDPIRMRGLLGTGRTALAFALSGIIVVSGTAWGIRCRRPRPQRANDGREVAAALTQGPEIQQTADKLRPNPRDADGDRPQMYGRLLRRAPRGSTRRRACTATSARTDTVVLFGDSHAMMWGPAMDVAAKRRGWRLVTLAKQGCTIATAPIYNGPGGREYDECDTWRERTLRRIVRKEKPRLIVIRVRGSRRPLRVHGRR